jgi:hypothetical protein
VPPLSAKAPPPPPTQANTCDICNSSRVVLIKCKLVCTNCGTILQTCADL